MTTRHPFAGRGWLNWAVREGGGWERAVFLLVGQVFDSRPAAGVIFRCISFACSLLMFEAFGYGEVVFHTSLARVITEKKNSMAASRFVR